MRDIHTFVLTAYELRAARKVGLTLLHTHFTFRRSLLYDIRAECIQRMGIVLVSVLDFLSTFMLCLVEERGGGLVLTNKLRAAGF